MRQVTIIIAALLVMSPFEANAVPIFDFEGVSTGSKGSSFSLTSDGVTLTVTVETGGAPDLLVLESTTPVVGRGIIGMATGLSFEPMRFSFDFLIDSITFGFGDSGGDSDTPVVIEAFNAIGTLLGTVIDTYDAEFSSGKTATVNFAGVSYYILNSGADDNPDSLTWDVQSLTLASAVPEPGTLALFSLGLLGLGLARKRTA